MNLEQFEGLVEEFSSDVDLYYTTPQIETFNLISKLFNTNTIVLHATRNTIVLNIDEEDLEKLSIEDAKLLVRGGVRYDADYEFYMYV
jgi:hypothetical protein